MFRHWIIQEEYPLYTLEDISLNHEHCLLSEHFRHLAQFV